MSKKPRIAFAAAALSLAAITAPPVIATAGAAPVAQMILYRHGPETNAEAGPSPDAVACRKKTPASPTGENAAGIAQCLEKRHRHEAQQGLIILAALGIGGTAAIAATAGMRMRRSRKP